MTKNREEEIKALMKHNKTELATLLIESQEREKRIESSLSRANRELGNANKLVQELKLENKTIVPLKNEIKDLKRKVSEKPKGLDIIKRDNEKLKSQGAIIRKYHGFLTDFLNLTSDMFNVLGSGLNLSKASHTQLIRELEEYTESIMGDSEKGE